MTISSVWSKTLMSAIQSGSYARGRLCIFNVSVKQIGKIVVNRNTKITKTHIHTPLKAVDFGFCTKRKDKPIMPVFRVEKVKDYTIMPNTHLRNRQLSLRAKGLLCQMLSLPPEWNFTLQGLAYINKEGLDAITTIIHELEQAGYITHNRIRDEKGLLREMEYTVYSSPRLNDSYDNNPIVENPTPENPTLDFPTQGKPMQ